MVDRFCIDEILTLDTYVSNNLKLQLPQGKSIPERKLHFELESTHFECCITCNDTRISEIRKSRCLETSIA